MYISGWEGDGDVSCYDYGWNHGRKECGQEVVVNDPFKSKSS